jgi:hypothetical protein
MKNLEIFHLNKNRIININMIYLKFKQLLKHLNGLF